MRRPLVAGTLMTRIWADSIIPDDGMDVEPGHRYWNPHADKANRASYDYSALLYLNSHCSNGAEAGASATVCDYEDTAQPQFDGGEFVWLDLARDHVVQPRAGRLVYFTGGLENLHRLREVSAGTRYVIGMWFTCHAELEYRDEDDAGVQQTSAPETPGRLGRGTESPPPVPSRRRHGATPANHDDGARGTSGNARRDFITDNGLADTEHGLSASATMAEVLAAYETVLRHYDEAPPSGDNTLADASDGAWRASEPHLTGQATVEPSHPHAGSGNAGPGHRRDCGYPGITRAECVDEHGCLWDESQLGVPWCFEEHSRL